jgi:hypothetical protein
MPVELCHGPVVRCPNFYLITSCHGAAASLVAPKPALAQSVGERHWSSAVKVMDGKCGILTVSESDELSTYVARAEVAAAENHGSDPFRPQCWKIPVPPMWD